MSDYAKSDKMKKFFLLAIIIFAAILCFARVCTRMNEKPYDSGDGITFAKLGFPVSNKEHETSIIIDYKGFRVSYNPDTKIPNWVAWHLTRERLQENFTKPKNAPWHQDFNGAIPQADREDYRHSGWNRGHLCPVADCKWDATALYESYSFTNCVPQASSLNQGVWNQIERDCRQWAQKYDDVFIVCGPILYNQEHLTIGANQVVVPEAFFKVILCLNGTPKGIGYICKNNNGTHKKDSYVNSIRQVERISGYTFFPNLSSLPSLDSAQIALIMNNDDRSIW